MRQTVDVERLWLFMCELGQAATSAGRIYFTGGSTALLHGFREMTVDVDLKALPEPGGLFEAIAKLKNRLDINVELASPLDFVPVDSGWRDRSAFIAREGLIDYFHFDYYAQALAKIERGNDRDLLDVRKMVNTDLIDPQVLGGIFDRSKPDLIKYPAIHAESYKRSVRDFIESCR